MCEEYNVSSPQWCGAQLQGVMGKPSINMAQTNSFVWWHDVLFCSVYLYPAKQTIDVSFPFAGMNKLSDTT